MVGLAKVEIEEIKGQKLTVVPILRAGLGAYGERANHDSFRQDQRSGYFQK